MPKITLRPPTLRDRDAFLELVRTSRKLHEPWVYPPKKAAVYRKWVSRDNGKSFLVCRGRDIVGVINVNNIFYGFFCNAYLGYYAFERHAGNGYMTEGMRRLVRHAFRKLKLHRLEANIQPGNSASIRLVRRCGFRKEGFSPRYLKVGKQWRDHQRWAITAEDI